MATKRIYPDNASEAERRRIDALSDMSAYAYGFSDEKPGASYWLTIAGVLVACLIVIWIRSYHHA